MYDEYLKQGINRIRILKYIDFVLDLLKNEGTSYVQGIDTDYERFQHASYIGLGPALRILQSSQTMTGEGKLHKLEGS